MGVILLIDFGSTYTKIRAVDLEKEEVVGSCQAPSTVDTDMTIGLQAAFDALLAQTGVGNTDIEGKLACSSAAGGLRLVASGLVPRLTTEAAKRAALGAGAKVIGVYSYQLTPKEIAELEQKRPDLVLLVGGTDGGNTEVILHNARMLANSDLVCPIVVAGNKVAAEEVEHILHTAGKYVAVAANVMPEVSQLNVEPTRAVIREMFMRRITHGKGLNKAERLVGSIIMPTPMAVLRGAALLAQGTPEEAGLGDLIVVDVGGATTDVDSLTEGNPTQPGVVAKGLPEPYAKRTVEGDLGIRYSAPHILEIAGEKRLRENLMARDEGLAGDLDLGAKLSYLSDHIDFVPQTQHDSHLDVALARSSVEIAMQRHAGVIETCYLPSGTVYLQHGKDLTQVKRVIGTGGIFSYGQHPRWILEGTLYSQREPLSLRPKAPEFFIDERYLLYAIGLLAEIAPEKALRIMKKHLRKV
ncbi:MAG TPA: MutL protein [Dehalococcoidia bacterium]|jgi:uncharacterized protein (TIGR01319 family)|nr:MutL protein [Dehalococcoidia bacterium]